VCAKINNGISEYLERHAVESVSKLVGSLQL
jgi:dihydroorotate dehydrogenase